MRQRFPVGSSTFRRHPVFLSFRPSTVIPAQAGIYPARSHGSPAKPPGFPSYLLSVIPAQAGIYLARSDGSPAKPPEKKRAAFPGGRLNHLSSSRPSVIPAFLSFRPFRHPGASRNLPCPERRLASQTTRLSIIPAFPSSRRKPESTLPEATVSQPNHPAFHHTGFSVIPAQAGIYLARSDG